MRTIDVVIPSYKRIDKLRTCLASVIDALPAIQKLAQVQIYLCFSDQKEMEYFETICEGRDNILCIMLDKPFKASEFWNDHLCYMTADALCYLTDDVVISPTTLYEGLLALETLKMDGVVGFKVGNAKDGQPVKAAFGMIGLPFALRFPDKAVFCPEYFCFYLDYELEQFARSLYRFIFSEASEIHHFHPSFTGLEPDETHKWHRRNAQKDVETFTIRQAEKLTWGQSFTLVGGG